MSSSSFTIKGLFLVGCVLFVLIGLRLRDRFLCPDLILTFFDVGQGDSSLIQLPGGGTILVDAGGGVGEWNIGSAVLFRELARLGILHLDLALLSHPDQDHIGGFVGLFESLGIGSFYLNATFLRPLNKEVAALMSPSRVNDTEFVGWSSPGRMYWAGAKLLFLPVLAGKSNNDRSLVLFLEFEGCRVLFSGDLSRLGERSLPQLPAPLSVLKVSHHGSRYSSDPVWLSQILPRYAVFSAGLQNPYGHPHPETTERFKVSRVLRTDLHGYVRFRFQPGGKATCETAWGPCGEWACEDSLR